MTNRGQINESMREHFPPEWFDVAIMTRIIGWHTNLARAVALHGMIDLALEHPDLSENFRRVGEEMLTHLQEAMEAEGLPPPHAGWRAEV